MSFFLEGTDPFDGLRILPREPEQLRHHLSRIHHTLQTKYFISAELSEFALQPDRTDDFVRGYQKEIERTIADLNAHSRRAQIKVRVDVRRFPAGFEARRTVTQANATSTPQSPPPPTTAPVDGAVSPSLTNGWGEIVSPSVASKLESRQEAEHQLFLAGQTTPAMGKNDDGLSPDALSTGGAAFVNSEAKTDRDSYLFSTPPEFKGFGNAPHGSPSDTASPRQ